MALERPLKEEDFHIWRIYVPLQTSSGLLLIEWRYEPRAYRLGGDEGVVLKAAGVERLIQALARKEPWAPGPLASLHQGSFWQYAAISSPRGK